MEEGGDDEQQIKNVSSRPINRAELLSHTMVILQQEELTFSQFRTGRIKCCSIDVAENHLALGSSNGSIYIYDRESLRFIQLVTNPQLKGPISHLKFTNDEKFLAIVTQSDHDITSDPEYICKCDSEVIQIDFDEGSNQLLASSRIRCVTINFTTNAVNQIGKQNRNGPYGAIFHKTDASKKKYVVSSRPRRWIWRADLNGKVLKTLKFQDGNLNDVTFKFLPDGKFQQAETVDWKSVNFGKLAPFGDCLLSWTENAIFLLDSDADEYVACYVDIEKIKEVIVYQERTIYILHDLDEIKVTRINFQEIPLLEHMRIKKKLAKMFAIDIQI